MKIKKKYKESIICTLKCYNLLLGHIEDLKKLLEEVSINNGVSAITYDGDGIKTNKINKLVENTALRNLENKDELEQSLISAMNKTKRIDLAISNLSEIECQIIKLKYINNSSWNEIAGKTSYSARNCQYILNQSIEKLSVIFYGESAFD